MSYEYAILARYHICSGNNSSKITLKELFNDTNTIATADLPCNIDALIKQLLLLSSYTAEDFINNYPLSLLCPIFTSTTAYDY